MVKTGSGKSSFIKNIKKRDGQIVPFDESKIANAIGKAMAVTGEGSSEEAELVANKVLAELVRITKKFKDFVPDVEGIQDIVEKELILSEYVKSAKEYILYSQERAKVREQNEMIPADVRKKITDDGKYFISSYQEFIFYQFYSRWREELGRRETWVEAIDRFMDFMKENMKSKLTSAEYSEVKRGNLETERLSFNETSLVIGQSCQKFDVTAYNCAYIAPTTWKDLSEIMYVSM